MAAIKFTVYGVPRPGGSKKAFRHFSTGRIIVKEDCERNAEWRSLVNMYANKAMRAYDETLMHGAIIVECVFYMPRPQSHFKKGTSIIKDKFVNLPHAVRPDVTKLWRSTEDAMTSIVWHDDAQITKQTPEKMYVDQTNLMARAEITVTEL